MDDPNALNGYIVGALSQALKHDLYLTGDDIDVMRGKLCDLRGVCLDIMCRCAKSIDGLDTNSLPGMACMCMTSDTSTREGRVEGDW